MVFVIFDQVHKNWENISSELRIEVRKSQVLQGLQNLYSGPTRTPRTSGLLWGKRAPELNRGENLLTRC